MLVMRAVLHAYPFRSGAKTAVDHTTTRSITTQRSTIQPPPLPGIFEVPGSRSLLSREPLEIIRQAFAGDASASVGQSVAVVDVFPVAGTSAVGLPIVATVEGKFTTVGDTAGFCGVTGSARSEITATRAHITDIAISADANRAIALNCQTAARVGSTVSSAIALMTVSGTTKAATLALGYAGATLGLSGKSAAEGFPASEVSGAFELGLSASVAASRQAVLGAVLAADGSVVAITDVASAASGDLSTKSTAITAVPLQAKSNSVMAFTRDAATDAVIDATSGRAITFQLDAVAKVDLAAGSLGDSTVSTGCEHQPYDPRRGH